MTILRIEHDPSTHTVRLAGELDHASAPDLVTTLAQAVDSTSDLKLDLKLDLRALTFMDSTGLHIIVNVARALGDRAALVLIGPTPPVARVLQIAGIVDLIANIEVVAEYPTLEEPHLKAAPGPQGELLGEVARARDPEHPVA
ncbi:MAG TPA: STAS domain-containing protein [Actinomycetota bacterium]|jgi:anti-anti-sigma factor